MKSFALTAALLAALFVLPARADDGAAEDYQKALDKENTDRDLNGAMEIYRSILKKHRDEVIAVIDEATRGLKAIGRSEKVKRKARRA